MLPPFRIDSIRVQGDKPQMAAFKGKFDIGHAAQAFAQPSEGKQLTPGNFILV